MLRRAVERAAARWRDPVSLDLDTYLLCCAVRLAVHDTWEVRELAALKIGALSGQAHQDLPGCRAVLVVVWRGLDLDRNA